MTSENADSAELEALFDSIVDAAHAPSTEEAPPPKAAPSDTPELVYERLGHMTRQLHNMLRELGYEEKLQEAAQYIPDARDRLNYIAVLTEQAAERVLNATDAAKPLQDQLAAEATLLGGEWKRLFDRALSIDEFKRLVGKTRDYLGAVPEKTRATNEQLTEIMMAQDFQDLTGQVIKKTVEMAQQLEQGLVQLLLMTTPAEKRTEVDQGLLNGPVINSEGRTDVVTNQAQVDDLLESLGF